MIAMRRLKKLTRYLLGTSEVYQELCPDPHAETLQVPVDSDWADDRETRQSCSGRSSPLSRMRSAHVGTHAKDESSFERRGRVVRHWFRSNRRFGSSTTLARMAVQNSTATSDGLTERTRGVQATRAGSNETHRAEDAHSAGMAENGTTSNPQSIDSRQSRRPHDQSHESRETDHVRTSVELARSILHRLEPPCTVTSDWCNRQSITEILTVEMNTVNSFQYHRLRKRVKLGYNDDEDRDRHVTTALPPQTVFGNPQNVSANVAGMMTGADRTSSM